MALRENIEGLLRAPTTPKLATRIQVQYLQIKISDLSKEYWRLGREWWKIRTSFMDGPLKESIIDPRNQNGICMVCFATIVLGGEVAVSETADAAIVAVGNSFRLAIAQWNVPAVRRIGVSNSTKKEKPRFREDFKTGGPSYFRIRDAALLGLMNGSWKNPSDHIRDLPPKYMS